MVKIKDLPRFETIAAVLEAAYSDAQHKRIKGAAVLVLIRDAIENATHKNIAQSAASIIHLLMLDVALNAKGKTPALKRRQYNKLRVMIAYGTDTWNAMGTHPEDETDNAQTFHSLQTTLVLVQMMVDEIEKRTPQSIAQTACCINWLLAYTTDAALKEHAKEEGA